jgi:hypothetical protein
MNEEEVLIYIFARQELFQNSGDTPGEFSTRINPPIENCSGIRLVSAQFPLAHTTIEEDRNDSFKVHLWNDPNWDSYTIKLEPGKWGEMVDFCDHVQAEMNKILGDSTVVITPLTRGKILFHSATETFYLRFSDSDIHKILGFNENVSYYSGALTIDETVYTQAVLAPKVFDTFGGINTIYVAIDYPDIKRTSYFSSNDQLFESCNIVGSVPVDYTNSVQNFTPSYQENVTYVPFQTKVTLNKLSVSCLAYSGVFAGWYKMKFGEIEGVCFVFAVQKN